MKLEDYMSGLEEKIGTIVSVQEYCPGAYCIEADNGGRFHKEYYAVLDNAPFAGQVSRYGRRFRDLRLYEVERYGSGWEVVQYEINKYNISTGKKPIPEELFHDITIHAKDAYSEYFGDFPVPYHTPGGYTLRYRTLGNGIYWLETSRGRELLALCYPIWNTELSTAALALAKMTEQDRIAGASKSLCYIFFSREDSCVPIYELVTERPAWEETLIHLPALMNALWEYAPKYAMHLNGGTNQVLEEELVQSLEKSGLEIIPQPTGKRVIGMFPGEGTDFLLLK